MNTKTFDIPDGYEFEKIENGQIILKQIEPELPRKWEDLKELNGYYVNTLSSIGCELLLVTSDTNRNIFPRKEEAEAALALAQLLQLRKAWVIGWEPVDEWYGIFLHKEENYCTICRCMLYKTKFSFPTKEMAEDFANTFHALLMVAKELY